MREESPVNVLEGLTTIRGRLESNGADPATLRLVDDISKRASLPAAQQANAQSLLQLVRMLARSPLANSNARVYNDLVGLEEQLQDAAAAVRAEREAEERRPTPKLKKFYKEQKAKEKKA
jgi:hypothetical protein